MNKKSIHKLSSPAEESSAILGISSHENDYRLSWALNEFIGFHLVKSENHVVFNPKINEEQEFSVYTYTDDDDILHRLISNRCDNGFLLEEFKNIDFILTIQPVNNNSNLSEMVARIKLIPFVAAVFPINSVQAKAKKRGL